PVLEAVTSLTLSFVPAGAAGFVCEAAALAGGGPAVFAGSPPSLPHAQRHRAATMMSRHRQVRRTPSRSPARQTWRAVFPPASFMSVITSLTMSAVVWLVNLRSGPWLVNLQEPRGAAQINAGRRRRAATTHHPPPLPRTRGAPGRSRAG